MKTASVLRSYELIVDQADGAFRKMQEEHGSCMTCELHCSECCHAVFGLFLVEAVNIKRHFDLLDPQTKKEVLYRCSEAERGLKRLEKKLEVHGDDPGVQASILSRERIRCPLLDDGNACVLYAHRPITCRVYGIPTKVQRKARVCGKTRFEEGVQYPLFDLDGVHSYLYALSKDFLKDAGGLDPENAAFLISVPRAVTAGLDELIRETFG